MSTSEEPPNVSDLVFFVNHFGSRKMKLFHAMGVLSVVLGFDRSANINKMSVMTAFGDIVHERCVDGWSIISRG